jgi:hypothetical protein
MKEDERKNTPSFLLFALSSFPSFHSEQRGRGASTHTHTGKGEKGGEWAPMPQEKSEKEHWVGEREKTPRTN